MVWLTPESQLLQTQLKLSLMMVLLLESICSMMSTTPTIQDCSLQPMLN